MLFSEVVDVPKGPKVVAVGSFDGVHLGHQYLLHQALAEAKSLHQPLLVYTFDPPTKVFTRGEGFLMDLTEKVEALRALGVELILAVAFNEAFAKRKAEEFLEDLRKLGASRIYVGEDFRFGQGRGGGPENLAQVAPVRTVPLLTLGGEPVKSSRIRALLQEGRVEEARHLLGRPYGAYGVVVEGEKLGRKLGFPTANLAVHPNKVLPPGVFAVEAQGAFGRYKGVANVGTRPTVNGSERRLEVHLLGFAGDLYGEEMRLVFLKRLREERRFASLEELQAQIAKDVASARAYFGL
ncbi:riboflavin biosynthesis protein RibF [Thermus scotoductus]|uniref:Riboflavin biosynthesis protein n=1 Tax=Thermus scotoductus TaxID=37636 RepID=A0A430S9L9_THESC|nr:riboflavin biosynthesis protein RibF [Thermus scotoductus]RTG96363.1 riboflavin biosynthesis protein RibF [Thermus scotoductus]RTH06620.1 riboflavin biosynthesis protein RibF [Thermus scotoductus]RTH10317.1 riboflavin biosynthesis protein RibF [Thermus scotoductus]RTH12021.1 riboflavin biosynthesis protein RibF [Thermus scotoductus]RTH16568.1 riboflavin biosynthesis protein RibF [Thermus scotoductus]